MSSWGQWVKSKVSTLVDFNQATLSGAIDVVAVRHPDGEIRCTPFHVRVGKLQLLKSREKIVRLRVNGEDTNLKMKLGAAGEAFFVEEVEEPVETELMTSPLASPTFAPGSPGSLSTEGMAALSLDGEEETLAHLDGDVLAERLEQYKLVSDTDSSPPVSPPMSPLPTLSPRVTDRTQPASDASLPDESGPPTLLSPDDVRYSTDEVKWWWDWGFDALPVRRKVPKRRRRGRRRKQVDETEVDSDDESIIAAFRESVAVTCEETVDAVEQKAVDAPDQANYAENAESDGEAQIVQDMEDVLVISTQETSVEIEAQPLTPQRQQIEEQDAQGTGMIGSLMGYLRRRSPSADAADIANIADLEVGSSASNVDDESVVSAGDTPLQRDDLHCDANLVIKNPDREVPGDANDADDDYEEGSGDEELEEDEEVEEEVEWPIGWELSAPPLMSLCAQEMNDVRDRREGLRVFARHIVTFDEFRKDPTVLSNPNMLFLLRGKLYSWAVAAPFLASALMYGQPMDSNALDELARKTDEAGSSRWGWSRWFRRGSENVASPNLDSKACPNEMPRHFYRKRLKPTSEQLQQLNLRDGPNKIEFVVSSALQGERSVEAMLYMWHPHDRIVISDVDGTITKSDVLGHIMPIMGRDWSHEGVAALYSSIERNGYKILYLTSRAIGQTSATKGYLTGISQDDVSLPVGPVLLSPDRLLHSFAREVIFRRPQEFKISALQSVRALFPHDHNPFYAGFGNRETDSIAYRNVSVPEGKIFTINPSGELQTFNHTYTKSYSRILSESLLNMMFPPLAPKAPEQTQVQAPVHERYNDANHWRPAVGLIESSDDDETAL